MTLRWCSLTCSLFLVALTLTGCHKPALTPLPGTTSLPPSSSPSDCGPRALWLVCQRLGIQADLDTLRQQAGTTDGGTSLEGLAKAAKANGLKAEGVQMDGNALARLDRPALAWVDGDHYVAVLSVEGERATIHDPNHAREEVITTQELLQRSGGILLLLSR